MSLDSLNPFDDDAFRSLLSNAAADIPSLDELHKERRGWNQSFSVRIPGEALSPSERIQADSADSILSIERAKLAEAKEERQMEKYIATVDHWADEIIDFERRHAEFRTEKGNELAGTLPFSEDREAQAATIFKESALLQACTANYRLKQAFREGRARFGEQTKLAERVNERWRELVSVANCLPHASPDSITREEAIGATYSLRGGLGRAYAAIGSFCGITGEHLAEENFTGNNPNWQMQQTVTNAWGRELFLPQSRNAALLVAGILAASQSSEQTRHKADDLLKQIQASTIIPESDTDSLLEEAIQFISLYTPTKEDREGLFEGVKSMTLTFEEVAREYPLGPEQWKELSPEEQELFSVDMSPKRISKLFKLSWDTMKVRIDSGEIRAVRFTERRYRILKAVMPTDS